MDNNEKQQCTGKSKTTGERCKRMAVPGYKVCYYHGANPKNDTCYSPEKSDGKHNAFKHGLFAKKFFNEEDQEKYELIIEQLRHDFEMNTSSDQISLEAMGMAFLKYSQALKDGNTQAAESLDRIVRAHLKNLKATKLDREGATASNPKTTPAEWAASLLEKCNDIKNKKTKKKQMKKK